jgi:SpoVK/Ycf46/Vps4 family AAA+-type ATPase
VYLRIEDYDYNKCFVKLFFTEKTEKVSELIGTFNELIRKNSSTISKIALIIHEGKGFKSVETKITPPEIDFDTNYNEDFLPIHKLIHDGLAHNFKGIVLLHGEPGTGKTTYIKHLISTIDKNIIYMPSNAVEMLSSPEFIPFLLKNKHSVLVIEEAEKMLMSRNNGGSQAISNILNLTDGILSDCLNIQVVATFNTDILNIDSALLRKGRLIAKYEFKPLEEAVAIRLADKLGVELPDNPTLTNIYNAKELSFTNSRNKIGFK